MMLTHPLYILGVLSLFVVVSEWLVRKTALRHIGTALLVILVTAVAVNVGILPAGSTKEAPVPVYDGIFTYVAPLSIFWLLLRVNLRDVLAAGGPIVILFLVGSFGTMAGVFVGMWLVDAPQTIGPLFPAVGGMFVGTYTGGSINFNAIALTYDVVRHGVIYGGSIVVDNIITTVWMVVTLAMPRFLAPLWPRRKSAVSEGEEGPREVLLGIEDDTETLHPMDLGIVMAMGFFAVWISDSVSAWLSGLGVNFPSIIILTIIALVVAQIPVLARSKGAQLLGMYSVYIFLAVIGAFCDLAALKNLGGLGITLLLFATTIIVVHGIIVVTVAWLAKIDPDIVAVTSQANIGGSTSALALARSIGRNDLVLPGVLVGALGNAIGTFLGFWAAAQILPLLS